MYSMSTTPCIAMFSFWLAFLGVSSVSTLALNPADTSTISTTSQALSNYSDTLQFLPSLINTTNSSTLSSDRVIDWSCNEYPTSSTYRGYGTSCFDAVRQMAFVARSATQQLTWGDRGELGIRRYDVNLPQRVYSCKRSQYIASSVY